VDPTSTVRWDSSPSADEPDAANRRDTMIRKIAFTTWIAFSLGCMFMGFWAIFLMPTTIDTPDWWLQMVTTVIVPILCGLYLFISFFVIALIKS
tara:strand:- start:290 stop:571 length:282 start_codon:yes stop_codon:yes gene_type:complete